LCVIDEHKMTPYQSAGMS